ncbi:MAG: FAD-dependent oxidoreductase, partial [Chloroflexota bacterium]
MVTEGWRLKDGDHVAVVGGGPAGSLFAHFALRAARAAGVRPRITIYEGKAFSAASAAGCNQSAGVVAQDFATNLRAAGIVLPESLVQRHIRAYRLITHRGEVRLEPPGTSEEVLTVYRGKGPRGSEHRDAEGLDDYLLAHTQALGVRVVPHYISRIEPPHATGEPMHVTWMAGDGGEREAAQLVVIAVGANSKFVHSLGAMGVGYVPPRTMGSIQVEVHLGSKRVEAAFGDAITVYALDISGVRFAAITPKYDYITITL